MPETLFRLDGILRRGRGRNRLGPLDLEVPGGRTAVLGPSGSGKSTLLHLLVGYEEADAGELDAPGLHRNGGPDLPLYWVPQDGGLWPELDARAHLAAVRSRRDAEADARLLGELGLGRLEHARPAAMSMGERQRLSLARALASGARLLVLDEPFAHIEPARREACWQVLGAFLEAPARHLLFATHRPEDVLAEARSAICLEDGRCRYAGPVETLYRDPPDEALAAYLGPANWFGDRDAGDWIAGANGRPCLRPEELRLEPEAEGALEILETRKRPPLSESRVRQRTTGRERLLRHLPSGGRLREGVRVSARLLTILVLCAALAGCGNDTDEDAELAVEALHSWRLPAEGARIPAPRSLAVGPDGTVVALDTVGRVLLFTPGGELLRSWAMPAVERGRPEGVAVLSDGRIAICDTHYHRVVFFSREGAFLGAFGSEGRAPGEFIYPVAILEAPDGTLYVAEYGSNDRVQQFTAEGTFLRAFGAFGTGTGELQRPSGLAWTDAGLVVADAINNRLLLFSPDGTFLRRVARAGLDASPDGGARPLDLGMPYDTEAFGRYLYAVEYVTGRLTRLDLQTGAVARFGRTGSERGEFRTPWGMALGPGGEVYVADTGNRRIVRLETADD